MRRGFIGVQTLNWAIEKEAGEEQSEQKVIIEESGMQRVEARVGYRGGDSKEEEKGGWLRVRERGKRGNWKKTKKKFNLSAGRF